MGHLPANGSQAGEVAAGGMGVGDGSSGLDDDDGDVQAHITTKSTMNRKAKQTRFIILLTYRLTNGRKTEWMTSPQSEKCVKLCKAIQFWLKFASL